MGRRFLRYSLKCVLHDRCIPSIAELLFDVVVVGLIVAEPPCLLVLAQHEVQLRYIHLVVGTYD